jgi:hypothetical protein
MTDKSVKWFDLSRFSAALKVVANSPLRGIPMTCLEVKDEPAFTMHVHGSAEGNAPESASERRHRVQDWWDGMRELGFNTRAEFYEQTDESRGRAFRLYSDRQKFTLSEMQRIVPGVTADDFRLMPVADIAHRPEVPSEMVADWKQFAETVLAHEAVSVWAPKVNPFEKPWAQARELDAVLSESLKGNRSPLFGSDPSSRWFVTELGKSRYRENALMAFYADQEAAVAAGYAQDEVEEVTLPYALPLWVEKHNRVVALKDVRHVPEVLVLPPKNYIGSAAKNEPGEGLVVNLLRESRAVEAVYREEVSKWRAWKDSADPVDREALRSSLQEVIGTDARFGTRFPVASSYIDKVLDADDRMKPLEQWGEAEHRVMLTLAKRFVPDDAVDDIFDILSTLDARLREQDAERAKEVAKEELRRVAQSVQAAEGDASPEKVRHEDAGEKIGGARKDFHRRAMTADDLEAMNDFERQSLVVKKNVWPSLDYAAMRENGVSAQAAIAIKYLKDAINVEPDRRHSQIVDDPEGHYIRAVGEVRDAMSEVKTLDEFKAACLALYKAGRGDSRYIYGGSSFQVAIGNDASHLLYGAEASFGWGDDIRTEAVVPSKIMSEIRKRGRRVAEWGETATEDQLWGTLIKTRAEKSDAEKQAETEKAEQDRELHRPHLEVVERIGGEDWRGGRDITAQDLMDHFGFRAIEFGNWLPQDERQTVLNMAFDSLCDLADGLGIPPAGVSFNGELAVAFGSRGRGGKHAALAHYEPARDVINLTRLKGAGSLAHEWSHALAWRHGGRMAPLAEKSRPAFDGDPMPALVDALQRRPSKPDELADRSQKEAEKHKRYAESWCFRLPPESREVLGRTMDELFAKTRASMHEDASKFFSSLPEHEKDMAKGTRSIHPFGVAVMRLPELAENICDVVSNYCKSEGHGLLKKESDAVDGNVQWMLRNMSRLVTVEAARDHGVTLDARFLGENNAVETEFLKQAKALDETRSSPYWATVDELFARAGAQFILYELEAKGVRSDYLVYGADESRYVNHPIGNPNPTGEDRLALREHFSALIEDFRIRLLRSKDVELSPEI